MKKYGGGEICPHIINKKEVFIMELKGSKTERNLMEAFAGESQARNKYTYYAAQAISNVPASNNINHFII